MCQGYTKVTLIRFRITDLTRRYKNFISTNGSRASGIIIRMYLYHRFFFKWNKLSLLAVNQKQIADVRTEKKCSRLRSII